MQTPITASQPRHLGISRHLAWEVSAPPHMSVKQKLSFKKITSFLAWDVSSQPQSLKKSFKILALSVLLTGTTIDQATLSLKIKYKCGLGIFCFLKLHFCSKDIVSRRNLGIWAVI